MATEIIDVWSRAVNLDVPKDLSLLCDRFAEPTSSDEGDEQPYAPVVLDNGSETLKVGFANALYPQEIPCVVGHPVLAGLNSSSNNLLSNLKDIYVGDDARFVQRQRIGKLKCPFERGLISDWKDVTALWDYSLCRLGVTENYRDEIPLFMTESPINPKHSRERMVEKTFEQLYVYRYYMAVSGTLSVFSTGRTTGLAVEAGHSRCYVTPVYDGHALKYGLQRTKFAGEYLTQYLERLLWDRGIWFSSAAEKASIQKIKQKLAYVADDYETELNKPSHEIDAVFELPDGQLINISYERFRCTEILFRPTLISPEGLGLAELVCNSIVKTPNDLHRELMRNIILAGGTCLLPGLADRLQTEIDNTLPNNFHPRVIAEPERKYAAWIGGSILSTLSTFDDMWVTKDEYDEYGPIIVNRKCW